MSIRRVDVERFPPTLEEGVLYVSEKFELAAHLCACGCGHKVLVMLGDGHIVTGSHSAPSVTPSIGVWDAPCRSHYWILEGSISWDESWSEEEIRLSWTRQLERHSEAVPKARQRWSFSNVLSAVKHAIRKLFS